MWELSSETADSGWASFLLLVSIHHLVRWIDFQGQHSWTNILPIILAFLHGCYRYSRQRRPTGRTISPRLLLFQFRGRAIATIGSGSIGESYRQFGRWHGGILCGPFHCHSRFAASQWQSTATTTAIVVFDHGLSTTASWCGTHSNGQSTATGQCRLDHRGNSRLPRLGSSRAPLVNRPHSRRSVADSFASIDSSLLRVGGSRLLSLGSRRMDIPLVWRAMPHRQLCMALVI
jgi:hypothetical protein